jgi:hypothetical protein
MTRILADTKNGCNGVFLFMRPFAIQAKPGDGCAAAPDFVDRVDSVDCVDRVSLNDTGGIYS